jgi:MFS family permease
MGQSFFFIGSMMGTLGLGIMADHIGRLPVLVLANVLSFLGNAATSFTSLLTEFAASRLVAGLATDTNFFMMYIIGELTDCHSPDQWRIQDFFSGGGELKKFSRGQRERGSGGRYPPSQRFHSIYK